MVPGSEGICFSVEVLTWWLYGKRHSFYNALFFIICFCTICLWYWPTQFDPLDVRYCFGTWRTHLLK